MSALRDALGDLPDAVFADALESDDAYLLVLDLPGVTAETLSLRAERGRLHVTAERRRDVPADFEVVRGDRPDTLEATIPLPPDVSGDGAEATVDRGVLQLRLPKAAATAETTIPVEDG